jgi:hypothetical protein
LTRLEGFVKVHVKRADRRAVLPVETAPLEHAIGGRLR